ncbi:hypothetical protein BGZ70_009541 [Mortierella alpina]|uniref:Uncharacterized protein n=1 Tax=Mortierella alpina TaxID=64518 RepID=A0A9P6J140_MORAP|nr:hypothetical protein BGZ70_009541 [Mortierella alpina]
METKLKQHAQNIVDTLYDWLFDNSRAYHDPSPYATACVKPYANGEDTSGGSLGYGASGYASIVRDKVAAAASSASSAAASLTSHPRLHQSAGVSETLQQLTDPAFWRNLSPTAAWDSFIKERASYVHELQSRLGWEHLTRLAERWEVEPRIVVLLMLLPVILLLLSSCVFMGAGHTTDDGPPPHQGSRHGKRADPFQASHDNADSASSSSSKQGNSSSGASSSGSGKGSKSRHGSKKGGAQDRSADNFESSKMHASMPKGSVTDGGSKAAMLGSIGFRGAELQHFLPIDIYAAMGIAQPGDRKLESRDAASLNRAAGKGLSSKRSSSQAKNAQTTVRQDDNLVSSIMEDVVGPSDSQQEQAEIDLDNHEEYEDDVLDGNVPASKTGNSGAKKALGPTSKKMEYGERSPVHAKAGKGGSTLSALNRGSSSKKQGHQESNQQQQSYAPEQDHRDKQGAGPAGPDSGSSIKTSVPISRTRVPRAHSFKEADRHRHQPHISSRANNKDLFGRHPVENQVDGGDYQVSHQYSLAFKIMDFAQRNSVMKNLDAISGGVLSTAMATLAAGTAIAESSTNAWKGDFTTALDVSNLKTSFDQAMVEGGLEGSGIDQDNNWDLRSIASRFSISSERPVSTARRFSVEDISVGPRTKYAIYSDPPQRSKVQVTDDEAPVNHDPKESDENVKVIDYQSYNKSTGKAAKNGAGKSPTVPRSKVQDSDHEGPVNHDAMKPDEDVKILDHRAHETSSEATTQNEGSKNPSAKSAAGVDSGNATVKATKTDAASRLDWGNAVPEVASPKSNEMTQSSGGSSAKSGAQSGKGAPKHNSKKAAQKAGPATKAGTSAKQAFDSVITISQDKLGATASDLHEKRVHADDQVHAAAQGSKTVVRSAQDSVKKLVGTAKHGTKATVQHAEDHAVKTISDVEKAVDFARDTAEKAIDTAADIMEASARAVEGPSKTIGSDIRTTIHDTKRNARSARKAARKAKNALIEDAMDSRKKIAQGAHHIAHEARDTLRAGQETVRPATGIAQYAKDTVIGLAGNVVQSAANQARSAMDSVVGTTKKTLWSTVVEPVKVVEHMVESTVEIGLGTVDAAIQGAREAAEKRNQEDIAAAHGTKVNTDGSRVNTKRSKDIDSQDLDGRRRDQGASNHAPAIASTPVHSDQVIQDDKAIHTQKAPTSKKARRKAPKRQDMASAAQATTSDTQVDSKNSKDGSSQSPARAESSRDLLSSAKHYAGGLGDAASELVHAAQIAAQTLTVVKDNTSAFIDAASNDLQGLLSGPRHGHHEMHDELRDIKNEVKQKVHFHGISSSASSAAKKADLVAQDYYDSLPDPEAGPPPTRSLASADTAHRSQAAPGPTSGNKNSTKKATLDHEEYVFKDKDGNNVPVADVDEADMEGSDSDESDGSDDDREDKHGRLGTLISHAPEILHSAKAAATAMAARVADVSYENFDLAKHSLSDMVDNLTENLAGHEERDTPSEDDSESDQERGGGAVRVRGSVQQKSTQGPGAKLNAQLRSSTVPGGKVASSKEGVVSFFPNAAPTHIHFQDHAYKLDPTSRHIDKDGFTIAEDPQLEHKHGPTSQTETRQVKSTLDVAKAHSSAQSQLLPRQHEDTSSVSNAKSTTEPRVTTPRTHRAKISAHPTSGALTYSAAVKMNVDEGDHGPLVGRTEDHKSTHQHDHALPRSDADSLFQNQDIYDDYDQTHPLQQEYTLDQQGQKAPLVREARRDSGFDLLL